MRIMIKGGIWKNIEDEILKAAVMKYGLNQWSRISSLLVRKSAKQCKARWYEWLDPSIKKTEWSKEEEEKLLHLAKIFPNQWRTIAPGIGRTPSQCIEHYEKLLEEAAGKEFDEETDPRKLKPGEIDPAPETRPPRPDPVDMDEDEKEMLQEARARLSNTRGKKAKRKMREKQLEEGRRLATVQRKRELRASGIEMELKKRIKPKVREMDYNVEVPFEHMVPGGIYEPEETPQPTRDQLMISAQYIEGSMRSEQEAKRKIEDERRMKRLKEFNLPAAINKISGNEFQVPMKRTRFNLPVPQLNQAEISNFSKLISQPETNEVTDMLVTNVDKAQTLLNPENIVTPQVESTVQQEALNAFMLSRSSTPLVGGFNVPLNHDASPAFTPNLIARSLTPNTNALKIARDIEPKEIKKGVGEGKGASILGLLPQPENEYEYQMEAESEGEDEEEEEEDEEEKNEEGVKDILKSEVVKKELPRPYVFNPKKYIKGCEEDLVCDEVVNLVLFDMYTYPMKGAKILPVCTDKELIEHGLMKEAQRLVEKEMREESGELNIDGIQNEYIFDYKKKILVRTDDMDEESLINSAKIECKYSTAKAEKLIKKTGELEEEIKNKTKDLQGKAHKIEKSIKKKYAKYDRLRIENIVFRKLSDLELNSINTRLQSASNLFENESIKERELTEKLQSTIDSISAWEWCNKT